MTNLEKLKVLLSQPQKVVITSHMRPDADALGSSLALALYLEKKGHSVEVIMPTEYPDFLKWMKSNARVLVYEADKATSAELIKDSDIVFCLDYNALHRIGEMGEVVKKAKAKKVLIDHHLMPEDFADFSMSDTNAAATAILIYEFIELLGDNELIDASIGECIYAGMMTDTGSFRFPSTNKQVHLAIADLMDKGLDHSKVHQLIYDSNSESRLRFLGYCLLNKLVVVPELHMAYISLSKEEVYRFNLQSGDTEGLVNYSLSINGIVFAAFFKEDEGYVKMSFRSKGDFSVNDFSRNHFSGGGHKNAAGGRSEGKLQEVIKQFEAIAPKYKTDLINSYKSLSK